MECIAEQEYVKVERKVNRLEQIDIEHKRVLKLYRDRIESHYREFPINEVMDMSYRQIGKEGTGLLYLHTTRGVFSYTVKSTPNAFMEEFKRITSNKNTDKSQ